MRIVLDIDARLHRAVKKGADKDDRSLTHYLRHHIKKLAEREGLYALVDGEYDPGPGPDPNDYDKYDDGEPVQYDDKGVLIPRA